jgi:hypothetical protein
VRILADNEFLKVPDEARVDSLAEKEQNAFLQAEGEAERREPRVRAVVEYDSPSGLFQQRRAKANVTLPEPGLEFLTEHYLPLTLGMVV